MLENNMYEQMIVDRAIKAGVPDSEIYHVVSELQKRGIYVKIHFPNRSPHRNRIMSLGGHSGGGRLGTQERELNTVKAKK